MNRRKQIEKLLIPSLRKQERSRQFYAVVNLIQVWLCAVCAAIVIATARGWLA